MKFQVPSSLLGIESEVQINRADIALSKKAYSTHRVPRQDLYALAHEGVKPVPGDVVLARVDQIGHHSKLELECGRRSQMYVGDQIIVCFGHRYATDQFHGLVGEDLGACNLVAAGGIAATVEVAHASARRATRITPLGVFCDCNGERINLTSYALPTPSLLTSSKPPVLGVVGSSMNAGKTTAVSNLVRGLSRAGYRVGAAKVTGTGAGGDRWQMVDAGAVSVLDFTDLGYASTYKLDVESIEGVFHDAVAHLTAEGADITIIEIADGLLQQETKALLMRSSFTSALDGLIMAAGDQFSAISGCEYLLGRDLPVLAVSGRFTSSPLAVREAEPLMNARVVSTEDFSDPVTCEGLLERMTSIGELVDPPGAMPWVAGAAAEAAL